MNNTLSNLPERALQLASQVGTGIKDAVPDKAIKWIETGAALGVLRTGTRVATKFVRRNPAVAVAAAAGAGLLWYVARRKAKQAQDDAIDGTATRIEAKRAGSSRSGNGSRTRSTGGGARRSKAESTNADH
ncbi:MAG TPA: hypothetical protein VHF02_07025 [Luteimonas sp.]|nr:hypothetical protein [Luteimonas sp.]